VLPPELTLTRTRAGKLLLRPLSAEETQRALALATQLLALTQNAIGRTREEVEELWSHVIAAPKESKLLQGLVHLIEARSDFESPVTANPEAVRRVVFRLAAEYRSSQVDRDFDRVRVLERAARELELSVAAVETALYGDLRGAQTLRRCEAGSPAALVEQYGLLQVQSILLRAVRVEAVIRSVSPDAYRDLFRKLKFRQLLYRIHPMPPSAYRLEIDGPLSLFEATTKYGMELALSLPALLSCGSVELRAELRWGKRRDALFFEHSWPACDPKDEEAPIRQEVLDLLRDLQACASKWDVKLSEALIDLTERGGGVLVPDLELAPRSPKRGAALGRILVEVLGFWSRDAVFQRIEAAERGLSQKVLFVVSSRLRVSEELLDSVDSASLYVFKGKINAHALLRKAEALLAPAATEVQGV